MKAHELLATPDKWTKGTYAKTATGKAVPAKDPNAVCWCIYGALIKCYRDDEDRYVEAANKIQDVLLLRYNNPDIVPFNDRRTHEEVLAVLKEADV